MSDERHDQIQGRVIMVILALRLAVSVVFAIGGVVLLLHRNWLLGAFALVLAVAFLFLTLRWARLAAKTRGPTGA